jgi:hypothetical protein
MDLLRKVRVLVGALAHRPFMPRPEKVDLSKGADPPQEEAARRNRSGLEAQQPQVPDTERVADLITQRESEEVD